MTTTTISGPAWDNSSEYSSLTSPEFLQDLKAVEQGTSQLSELGKQVAPFVARAEDLSAAEESRVVPVLQEAVALYEKSQVLLSNVGTYVNCVLSVDGRHEEAKRVRGQIEQRSAQLATAVNPFWLFLRLTSDKIVDAFLANEKTASTRFAVQYSRRLKDHALSLEQEDLLIGMGVNGPTAWGKLYDNISSVLTCDVETGDGKKTVGLAEASSLMQHADEKVRKSAYVETNKAWETQEEACASILNALSGWRHDVYKRRSHTKPQHYLDAPLYESRIQKQTLDAMMGAVKEFRGESQRVMQLMAKALGKKKLEPWDLGAPCPTLKGEKAIPDRTFDEAMDLIINCFSGIHPEMGDFARMMHANHWIEGTVGPTKRPGAYCTGFEKSRSPRVYMTFTGTMREVKTLAHELGHAFHSWAMRDMPYFELDYPMTLAETASIFAETVVNDALFHAATSRNEKLACAWSAAREVDGLLVNVSARYDFEDAFYGQRLEREFTPKDFKALMSDSWRTWYGDTLTEMNDMFWASKLHFAISEISFYNYPYIFGYLFSLGVYAQRDKLGDRFFESYVSLLRDTGRMTAEEVARKHLQVDLTKPDFWRDSLAIAKTNIDQMELAVSEAF